MLTLSNTTAASKTTITTPNQPSSCPPPSPLITHFCRLLLILPLLIHLLLLLILPLLILLLLLLILLLILTLLILLLLLLILTLLILLLLLILLRIQRCRQFPHHRCCLTKCSNPRRRLPPTRRFQMIITQVSLFLCAICSRRARATGVHTCNWLYAS